MISSIRFKKIAPVLIPLLFFIYDGFAGIDFGKHWDESNLIESAQISITHQEWLPQYYNYPSFAYWLTVGSALPELISGIGVPDRSQYVETHLPAHDYILRARHVFVLVTASTIVIVYLILLILHDNRWVALAGACLIAFSWEVGYHARWIAPDGLMMTAGALTLPMTLLAIKHPHQRRWLWLAAAATGLTIASKYNGGLVGLDVLVAAYMQWRHEDRPLRQLSLKMIQVGLICAATFVIITLGILLNRPKFIADARFELYHYRDFGHFNNTVDPNLPHAWLNLQYLAEVVFSPHIMLALLLAGFIPVGAYYLWRQSRSTTVLMLGFPVVYFLFMSTQRVMIVRNLLVLIPPMAVLAASGMYFIWQQLGWIRARRGALLQGGLALAIISIFVVNANWLIDATHSIHSRADINTFAQQAGDYITNHPDTTFCLSNAVIQRLNEIGYPIPANTASPETADIDEVVYVSSEVDRNTVPQNRPTLYRWFGPREVNYNYYSNWEGDSRIVVLDAVTFNEAQLPIENCMRQPQ